MTLLRLSSELEARKVGSEKAILMTDACAECHHASSMHHPCTPSVAVFPGLHPGNVHRQLLLEKLSSFVYKLRLTIIHKYQKVSCTKAPSTGLRCVMQGLDDASLKKKRLAISHARNQSKHLAAHRRSGNEKV
eukprot:6214629-Pleurochrysis_carterae.AAC.1